MAFRPSLESALLMRFPNLPSKLFTTLLNFLPRAMHGIVGSALQAVFRVLLRRFVLRLLPLGSIHRLFFR